MPPKDQRKKQARTFSLLMDTGCGSKRYMKILHTSDWHIGRTLYGRKRYDEHEAFLSWLIETIREERVEVLLIAGDVFDTSVPSNRAQELYYRFLCRVAGSCCRHVVVIAGNHDSPSFLGAPKELLRAMDIHVIGTASTDPGDEILVLQNEMKKPELIVCAAPYLRDRDIRVAEAGETVEDKEKKVIEGIRRHYFELIALAEDTRNKLERPALPIVAMGHLFTAGGQTVDGDGVRELYVGSLAHISAGIFPDNLDYLALGHLHVPQKVGGSDVRRYSGSPIPMGFGEARQRKSVCLVEISGSGADVRLIDVPVFRKLERIRGDWSSISARIQTLAASGSPAWLEIIYDGEDLISDLRERLEKAIAGSELEILRIKNNRIVDQVLGRMNNEETLDDLNLADVFERCLIAHGVVDDQRPGLISAYREIVTSLYDDDAMAR
jgi:DNA repair protein SbcD/Mre11